MQVLLLTAVPILVLLAAMVLVLVRRGSSPEIQERRAIADYRPLERLLSADDRRFLEGHPASSPKVARNLRRARRRVFRAYLTSIRRDFRALHTACRLALVESRVNRPDLAKALVRLRLVFFTNLLAVEARFAINGLGIGTVPVRDLVTALEAMRVEFASLAAGPAVA